VPSSLSFTPLNVKGEVIPDSAGHYVPLGFEVPSEGWQASSHQPRHTCEVGAVHLSGIAEVRAGAILQIRSYPGFAGGAFITCASAEYSVDHGSAFLAVGLLLDASQPGITPGALPNMKPLSGHPGVFEAPGEVGELVARRISGAWLVVDRGIRSSKEPGLIRRLLLLEHLRATVSP
jgi:hypothetical protein